MDWVKQEEVASRLRVNRASDERHVNEEENQKDEKDGGEYVQEEKYGEYGEKQGYEEEEDDDNELWDDYGNTKEDDNNAGERSRLHCTDKRKATSKYRGVSLNKGRKSKPWKARIIIDRKSKYLGSYATEEEAARAYDAEGARLG